MKLIHLTILTIVAGLSINCANSEFRVVDDQTQNTENSVRSVAASTQTAEENSGANSFPETNSSNVGKLPQIQTSTPPSGVSSASNTGASAGSCKSSFETGYMCAGGTGIPLNDNTNAESLCRSYCDGKNAACCALGRSNVSPGKVFCHASSSSRLSYNNNYAQLFPNLVAEGRTTSIAALNCTSAQAVTFSWGQPTAVSCLKNFDFRLYGEVPANKDVLDATNGDINLLAAHLMDFGIRENRDLNRNWASIRSIFNSDLYLAEQPDVLLSGVYPWAHYQTCGSYEGRRFAQ